MNKARWLCLLEFSQPDYGFERFNENDELLDEAWSRYFSPIRRRPPASLGIEEIDPRLLFSLGYLAYSVYPSLNKYRKALEKIIDDALKETHMENPKDFISFAKRRMAQNDIVELIGRELLEDQITEKDVVDLIKKAAIPEEDLILNYPLAQWYGEHASRQYRNYREVLAVARSSCLEVEKEQIEELRKRGFENTMIYLSTEEIDVYVATSMRTPRDFIINHKFISALMNDDNIKYLNLVFFDPTKAYVPERVFKGLLESLMVYRAKVVIYNAQERETFGKDAEASMALAHGKIVIVYVPRIFSEEIESLDIALMSENSKEALRKIKEIYLHIDELIWEEHDDFLNALKERDLLDENEVEELSEPDKDQRDAIRYVIRKHFPQILRELEVDEIKSALINKGYVDYPIMERREKEKIINYCVEKIQTLEERAFIFRCIHPLTFQISPVDGIPRGMFVTRSVKQTAKLLRAIFEGTLEYEERKIEKNGVKVLLLCDKITGSAIRSFVNYDVLITELTELRRRLRKKHS